MTDTNDLALQVRLLADRQEIADLVHRYAEFVRDRTERRCVELMTEDAWIELRHGDALQPGEESTHQRFEGREAILGSFRQVAGVGVVVLPMIHNLRIEIDGDSAHSRCLMVSSVRPLGAEFVGEYRDTFRRVEGHWRFASRTFIGFGDMAGGTGADAQVRFEAVKQHATEF